MSTNLVSFSFEENNVRTVVENDTPCWVAKDVCNVLGYVNDADAIAKHCKGVAKRYPLQTPGGMQEVRVISEPDLLRLIIGSRLPAAEKFERWVFEEHCPAKKIFGMPLDGSNTVAILHECSNEVAAERRFTFGSKRKDASSTPFPRGVGNARRGGKEGRFQSAVRICSVCDDWRGPNTARGCEEDPRKTGSPIKMDSTNPAKNPSNPSIH